jgi:hypothetical protein
MNSEREGINPAAKPSGIGCVDCSGLDGGGYMFVDAPNAVTLAAVTVHQISMHRDIASLQVTGLSRASSQASGGFTTIVQRNSSPARSFPLLTRVRWIPGARTSRTGAFNWKTLLHE